MSDITAKNEDKISVLRDYFENLSLEKKMEFIDSINKNYLKNNSVNETYRFDIGNSSSSYNRNGIPEGYI